MNVCDGPLVAIADDGEVGVFKTPDGLYAATEPPDMPGLRVFNRFGEEFSLSIDRVPTRSIGPIQLRAERLTVQRIHPETSDVRFVVDALIKRIGTTPTVDTPDSLEDLIDEFTSKFGFRFM